MRTLLAALAGLVMATSASAAVIYSTGFERSEGFVAGKIDSQNSWIEDSISGTNLSVETAFAKTGSQAVSADFKALGTDNAYGFKLLGPIDTSLVANKVILTEVDFYFNADTGKGTMGLDAYNVNTDRIGAVFVNCGDGSMSVDNTTSSATSTVAARSGAWNHLLLKLDFGTNTVSGQLNGTDLGVTEPIIASNLNLSDVDLTALSDTSGVGGLGYYDNYSVSTAVPEPSSIAILAVGLLGAMRRRRNP